jgi:hypothetical protein
MNTYTEDEIREYIESHDDDDAKDPEDLHDMFVSIYGREPDEDEAIDVWSWICNGVSHS